MPILDFLPFDFIFLLKFCSFFVERKVIKTIGQEKRNGDQKGDRLQISKIKFDFQISKRNDNLIH